MAYTVLNKCMSLSDNVTSDDPEYKVKFFYEFIDDTYSNWDPDSWEGADTAIDNNKDDDDTKSLVSNATSLPQNQSDANVLTPENKKLLQMKENHPLYLMVGFIIFFEQM